MSSGAIAWGITAFTDGVCIFLTFVRRLEVARDICRSCLLTALERIAFQLLRPPSD